MKRHNAIAVLFCLFVFSARVSVGCPPGLRGEQGTQGIQGLQGIQGPPGNHVGIIVQYSNGTKVGNGNQAITLTTGDDLTQVTTMIAPSFDVFGNDISDLVGFFFAQTGSSNPTLLFITYQDQGYIVYNVQQPGSSGGGGTNKAGPHLAARPGGNSQLAVTYLAGSLTSLPDGANVTIWATKTGTPGTNGNNGADGAEGPQGPPGPPAARAGSVIWVDAIYGDDINGTGSIDAPFQSITQALTLITPPIDPTLPSGWEINLAAGEYIEYPFQMPSNVVLRGAGYWQTQIVEGFAWTPNVTTGSSWGLSLELYDLTVYNLRVNTSTAGRYGIFSVHNSWIGDSTIITHAGTGSDSIFTSSFDNSYLWHVSLTGEMSIVGCQVAQVSVHSASNIQFTGNNFFGLFTLATGLATLYMTSCTIVGLDNSSFSWNILTSGSQVFADSTCASALGQTEGLIYTYTDNALSIDYNAQEDLNWAESPATVAIALDQLAERTVSSQDVSIAVTGTRYSPSIRATGIFPSGIQQPILTPLPISSISQDAVFQGFVYYESVTADVPVDSASSICTDVGAGYYMKMLFVNIGSGTVTLTTTDTNNTSLFTQPIGPTSQLTLAFLCQTGPLLSVFG